MIKLIFLSITSSTLLLAGFTLSNSGVITDSVTKLQWQAEHSSNSGNIQNLSWQAAIDHCHVLALNGGEWRLPNKNELLTIVDYRKSEPAINDLFKNTTIISSSYYWTSTTTVSGYGAQYARTINFYDGELRYSSKSTKNYVRCVRDVQ